MCRDGEDSVVSEVKHRNPLDIPESKWELCPGCNTHAPSVHPCDLDQPELNTRHCDECCEEKNRWSEITEEHLVTVIPNGEDRNDG